MVILLGWTNLELLKLAIFVMSMPPGRVDAVCSQKKLGINSTAVHEKSPKNGQFFTGNVSFGDVIFGCLVNQPITTKVINSHESCFCLKNLSQVSDSRFVDSIRARFNKNNLLWPRGSVTKRSEDIQKFGTEKWHPNQGTKIQAVSKNNFTIYISRFCPIGIHVCNIYLHFSWFLYGICR